MAEKICPKNVEYIVVKKESGMRTKQVNPTLSKEEVV